MAALPSALRAVLDEYARALDSSALSATTRRLYRSRVAGYLAHLASDPERTTTALTDPFARNEAVTAYRDHLRAAGKHPRYINDVLGAVNHFYRLRGLGAAVVTWEANTPPAPVVGLSPAEREAFLASPTGPDSTTAVRNRAVAATIFYGGLGGVEICALDVADVDLRRARVRSRGREVTAGRQWVTALRAWLRRRDEWADAGSEALFVARGGGRLAASTVNEIVRRIGEEAGVAVTAARLRATPRE